MDTKLAPTLACSLLCGAGIFGMQLVGRAAANDRDVTVAIHVSLEGLDPTQVADARIIYTRLKTAAWVACTRGNRAGLAPVGDVKGCYEKALGSAIRQAKTPTLTQIYLATHTIQDAAVYGLSVAPQIAGVPPH